MSSLHMDRITIGRNIRLRRKDLELTQAVVAIHLGINRVTLAKIETGRSSLPLESMPPLLELLQLKSVDSLFNQLWG